MTKNNNNNKQAHAYSMAQVPAALDVVNRIKLFNLNYFSYNRFIGDNQYLLISSQYEWIREQFGFKYDQVFIDSQLEKMKTGNRMTLWKFYSPENPLVDRFHHININHGISLFREQDGFKESFHFSSTNDNPHILEFYLNNINLLNELADDFVDQMSISFDQNFTNKFFVTDRMPIKETIKLSSQQKTCYDFLKQGYSNKQIARYLGISHRTVEGHVAALMNKLNITSRQELIGSRL